MNDANVICECGSNQIRLRTGCWACPTCQADKCNDPLEKLMRPELKDLVRGLQQENAHLRLACTPDYLIWIDDGYQSPVLNYCFIEEVQEKLQQENERLRSAKCVHQLAKEFAESVTLEDTDPTDDSDLLHYHNKPSTQEKSE